MTNIAAAIGLAQLERVEHHLAARKRVAAGYQARLGVLRDKVTMPVCEPWAGHVYWMYTVLVNRPEVTSRDGVMKAMEALGVETRPIFHPMHVLPPYAEAGDYPNADWCAARGINLPTHASLTDQDLDRIVAALAQAVA
jgi:perosamine synthetase